ncbi:MAG: 4-carboxy-4-hydroxy-2-oxoadipate aldolase/oxaloacetate decarboxylase [Natronomonas sp.]|uniref:4-carboxy-4-hydroxy-2-oxoadipate aldolase/oxaloacetate decarboxylase n=1 Tax=Natronomonas sp. TaxID=2184060 RepID=UPI0028708827|nr:4-carboxy-4-hydroxy-2-oxoadipate aldolase/oxaloacetate decarboxylase [Natronomonas sp.]MDR9431152.1 4-carboxy-4-hydroxy-2-oxoadipate aldolase/oxaloacetate decarboxylase [Natronomonas sp.]
MDIVREIERPEPGVIEAFRDVSAADAHEAMGKTNAMAPEIGPIGGVPPICGPACTVSIPPGDNLMVHVGSQVAAPGDVLVIATETTRAVTWGELLTENAIGRGIAGVVTAGNVRDAAILAERGFPVYAAAISQAGATKETPGAVNVPVSVGDVVVDPGDVIVGDADGVTVVPKDDADAVLARAAELADRETRIRERLANGESLYEIGGYDEKVESLGGPSLASDRDA